MARELGGGCVGTAAAVLLEGKGADDGTGEDEGEGAAVLLEGRGVDNGTGEDEGEGAAGRAGTMARGGGGEGAANEA